METFYLVIRHYFRVDPSTDSGIVISDDVIYATADLTKANQKKEEYCEKYKNIYCGKKERYYFSIMPIPAEIDCEVKIFED